MSKRAAAIVALLLLVAALVVLVPMFSASSGGARRSRAASAGGSQKAVGAPRAKSGPCLARAGETLAQSAGEVAQRIYDGEAAGPRTLSDMREVEGSGPLLRAVQRAEPSAIDAAVRSLVFSHTHIVRLRLTRGAHVLADVGGPYILAPAAGVLRADGRTLARYVLSVQDDLGYLKLVTRFLHAPLLLSSASGPIPIGGMLRPPAAQIPERGQVLYDGRRYAAFAFSAMAYPSGPLRVSLLMPLSPALARESCSAIRAGELALVSRRIAARYSLTPANFDEYAQQAAQLTSGMVLVHAGSQRLAGAPALGPRTLPRSGSFAYRGRSYRVSSFIAPASVGPVRVYTLIGA